MAATNNVNGLIAQARPPFLFGSTSTKRAKRKVITFKDTTNGIAVGGNTNKLLASDLGFTIIESCSNLVVYTLSSGAVVAIVPAAPSVDGTFIVLADLTTVTDAHRAQPADAATLSSSQGAKITVDGF